MRQELENAEITEVRAFVSWEFMPIKEARKIFSSEEIKRGRAALREAKLEHYDPLHNCEEIGDCLTDEIPPDDIPDELVAEKWGKNFRRFHFWSWSYRKSRIYGCENAYSWMAAKALGIDRKEVLNIEWTEEQRRTVSLYERERQIRKCIATAIHDKKVDKRKDILVRYAKAICGDERWVMPLGVYSGYPLEDDFNAIRLASGLRSFMTMHNLPILVDSEIIADGISAMGRWSTEGFDSSSSDTSSITEIIFPDEWAFPDGKRFFDSTSNFKSCDATRAFGRHKAPWFADANSLADRLCDMPDAPSEEAMDAIRPGDRVKVFDEVFKINIWLPVSGIEGKRIRVTTDFTGFGYPVGQVMDIEHRQVCAIARQHEEALQPHN